MLEQSNQLQAVADLKTAEIRTWLEERMGDARLIAEDPILNTELRAFLRDRANNPLKDSIRSWMLSLQKNFHYDNVLLLDLQEQVVLSASAHRDKIGAEGHKAVELVRARRDVVLSELHSNPLVPHIRLDIITPLPANSEPVGFVLLRIDPAQFLYPMIQTWPTPSPSAETLLVKRDGADVLYLNELRHKKNTALKLRLPLSSRELPAALAMKGRTGFLIGRDYRGIDVWSVTRPVQGTTWSLVAKIDREEIERPIRRNTMIIFLVALFLILVVALLILLLWHRQQALFHLLQFEAQRENEINFKHVFEAANVSKSITLPSGEISVNQAFCDMLGYSPEEMKYKKWQEFTPADDIGAIQKILDTLLQGKQNTARFNKRYVRRDGSIVWGDVSVAIRRDPSGKPLHFITTAVDITGRRQIEENLRASEIRYRRLFESAKDGILILDAETGMVVDVNPFLIKILGFSHEQFLGKAIWELGFLGDIFTNQEKFLELQERGYVRYEDLPLETAAGSKIDVEFVSNVYQAGRQKVIQCNIRDISQRKRTEMELRYLSSRNQALLEAIPDIIMEVDAGKVYTWANHAGINFFGADVIGKDASYYFAGEQKTYLAVQPIFDGQEEVAYIESWQRRRDNEKRLLAWWCRVLKDENGHVRGALSSARDITEIKRAEDALRDSERKFRETVINLDEGYYCVTLDGILLEHNQAFNRILGFDNHRDLKGVQLPDFWQDAEARKEYVRAFSATGSISNYMIKAKTQRGENISILANAHLVKDESGKPQRIEGMFLDISQRMRTEAEIRRLNEELEQRVLLRTAQLEAANKELEAFSYSVSHDLRAPLRAIAGFSRIILEEYVPRLDKEGKRLFNVIAANTHKMALLIDDLLAFSRLSRQQMSAAPINLAAMAKVIFKELKSQEKSRRIKFTVGALPVARGDHAMLQQILQNLLANAIKFTRTKPKARIELGGRTGQGENLFYVKDNGVGFDMQYVNKLFGVFQRLHSTDEFEGTGVGLAIVQRIVMRHGGRVWAESGAKGGATFFFTLPDRAANEPEVPPPQSKVEKTEE